MLQELREKYSKMAGSSKKGHNSINNYLKEYIYKYIKQRLNNN